MNTPSKEHTTDEQIEQLSRFLDDGVPLNPETIFHDRRAEKPVITLRRAYDLHFDLQTAAPRDQQWSCIDLNTYDGGSEGGISAIIGRGPDRKSAMLDCLEQFGEFDEASETPTPRESLELEENISEELLNDND
jgi:hypothetical protein